MGVRISQHARSVLAVLSEKRCHMTAEDVLDSLQGIGTATVYRALDHLTELGLVRRLALGKKSAVYEYIRDQHMHFVCSRCGMVHDMPADVSGMVRETAKCCGHQVEWSEVTAHGICRDCQNEEAPEEA
ncbi:MAG: transcriptional repressor [Clostridia bacterium]|nr:transcriptional repressor [Clostridia bacterium]